MNTTLHLNTNSISQPHPADRANPFKLPAFACLLRAVVRFFTSGDDPGAIHYVKSKYSGEWD